MSASASSKPKQYRIAIRRPVTIAMLFLTLIVFGWRSYQQLPINLMPDISYPTLTVRTDYEGAAPEDVEELLTRPLEEMLSIVSGMVQISSISSPGRSEIVLEFTWGTDMNAAQQDVRDRLDLFDPPRELTDKPVILRFDPTLDPVMRVALTPGARYDDIPDPVRRATEQQRALTAVREAAERHLKSDLEGQSGIAQVAVKGGREEEIQVLVDADRIKGLGLTLQAVVDALAQHNVNMSGGRLREGKTEYLVRTLNEYTTVREIGATIIQNPAGGTLRVDEVARVFLGARERETIVYINGREAVALDIFKEGDANTVQVANRIKDLLGFERELGVTERLQAAVAEQMRNMREFGQAAPPSEADQDALRLQARFRTLLDRVPEGTELTVISDQSRFITASINEVQNATVLGGLLALLILFLFLREVKTTVIIGVAIPISVIATFLPMFMQNITLNIMSLGGLALGVGMLVDNSIVVLESIFRCKEEGDGTVDAAERGAKEVGSAVTASTLTTISVFFPIAFVEGIAGQLFGDLALTVTFALLASLLSALFLIPMIASRESLALRSDRNVIWMLGAYREARGEHGEGGRAASALATLPIGLGYARAYLAESMWDTFGPSVEAIRAAQARGGPMDYLKIFVVAAIFPALTVLYVCQVLLRALSAAFVTVFFIVCLCFLLVFWVLRQILRALLWLPLTAFDRGFTMFRTAYGSMLHHALRFSPVVLVAVGLLAVHAGFTALNLGQELIPPMKQGEFGIRLEAPAGTRLEETERRAQRVEAIVRNAPEVDSVTVEIGEERTSVDTDRGENVAEFTVLLKEAYRTGAAQDQIIDGLRDQIAALSTDDINFTLPTLFSFRTAIELQVVGDQLEELRRVGQRVVEAIRPIPGIEDPELSVKPGYPEIIIELDRELLASRGLSPGQVAQRLRTEVQGDIATRFNRRGEKVDIRVRTDQAQLSSIADLRQLAVNAGHPPVPLQDVAHIRREEGPSAIRRIDQRQVVLVMANVAGRDLGSVARDLQAALRDVDRPNDYYFILGGQNRELETSYASLRFAMLLAIFLVYVVMACQFESFWHPALVMFSVPLAFIGVIYMLYFMEIPLSIMVFLGGIVLAGIVVNNSIVLVDYINQLRARGYLKHDAIIEAGKVRLRPIIMTTITTVLGLTPMAISGGEGAEMRQPMALTVMAGLSSATLLTLLIIPMVYYVFGGRDKQTT